MDKKKIFGIIIFIVVGFFMFSFANPNEEVKIFDCGDEDKSMKDEVTSCVQEKMDEGYTEKKALSNCRKTYCNGIKENEDKVQENDKEQNELKNNNESENNNINEQIINNHIVNNNLLSNQVNPNLGNNIISNMNNNINNTDVNDNNNIENDTDVNDNNNIENDTDVNDNNNIENDTDVNDNNNTENDTDVNDNNSTDNNTDESNNKDTEEKENLENIKLEVIEELKKYRSEYKYSKDNQFVYEELIKNYIEKINSSLILTEIKNYLDEGKNNIDELINKDFDLYKKSAIDDINNYVNLDDYRFEQQKEINQIIDETIENINKTETKNEIDELVKIAKELIDQVKTNNELTKEETKVVKFVDYNGNIISEQNVKIGESATDPRKLIKGKYNSKNVIYTFTGWNKEFTNVKDNLTIKAIYEVTEVKANLYVLKEGNTKPNNGGSLGGKAYNYLKTINLNLTEEIQKIIKNNKTVIVSLDKDKILSMISDKNDLIELEDFYYYDYYVIKYEKSDGFHIDCELMFDNEAFQNYKNSVIEELQKYSDSLNLSEENKIKSENIINESVSKINIAGTKEEVEEIVNSTKNELNNLLSSIKEKTIEEIKNTINDAKFTGSYIEKSTIILENAQNEINNAITESEIISLKDKYLNEIKNLSTLYKKTFVADINTRNIFKLKKLSVTDIASDVIINKISYVYPLGTIDVKYINNEYHSSIILDEEIEDLLFGSTLVKIEYTKDNVKYINTYNIQRNILSSITGLKLVSTDLLK